MVGTPCQMIAVAQMRMNPLDREDFEDPVALTVGIFCNWALDNRQLTAYLSERMDIAEITGMDIPPPPAEVLKVLEAAVESATLPSIPLLGATLIWAIFS